MEGSSSEHDTMPAVGDALGSYRIERQLGRGGMGVVYLAYDTSLHRAVALKTIPGTANIPARAQLLREARNAAALNHPNICTVYEVNEAGGSAFIAMEYVEGRTLRERIEEGPLPVADVLAYGIQAADALAYAHERGVIHRDFKAANALSTATGRLKIVDFGLATRADSLLAAASTVSSIVAAGTVAGTPYAMAPEQIRGEQADARSDVWALGVLLYEMASGVKPFEAPALPELFSAILRDRPRALPSSVPAALRSVIERCLEKDSSRRYQSAAIIKTALESIQSGVAQWETWRYRLRRRFVVPAVAMMVAAGLVILDVGGVQEWLRHGGAAANPIKLAVLPFQNLTGDPAQDYFSDGLTDEMISQLGRLHPHRLSVIARTSSMHYRGRDVPVDQIGRELGVDYVLEGSARRDGNRVRINVTLVQVHDQLQRWTDTFERELASILIVQSEIARGVAQSLALTLLPAEQARLESAHAINAEAFEAYLKGVSYETKLNGADLDRALAYFDAALKIDANYALAYVGIARVWSARQQIGVTASSEAAPHSKEALDKADALDDTLPEVHLGLANFYTWSDWNWAAGKAEFEKALALRPAYAEARVFYGHHLFITRRPDEGLAQVKQALELDPLSDFVQALCGQGFIFARRFDDAIRIFRAALDTAPRSLVALNGYARALYHAGRYDEALRAEKRVWEVRNDRVVLDALDRGYARGGYRAAMQNAADILAARWKAGQPTVNPNAMAIMFLRTDKPEQVFDWIDIAIASRDPNVPYVGVGPAWDPVRQDPRFRAIVTRLNLPPN